MAYRNALELYLHILDKDPGDVHARQRVAECYVKLNDPSSARALYSSLVKEKNIPPSVKYEYADVLCSTLQYNEAIMWYEDYGKAVPKDPLPKEKIDFINHINLYYRDTVFFRLGEININSDHADFGPQIYKDGLVFVSSRDHDQFIKRQSMASEHHEEALLNLFYAKKTNDNKFGSVEFFGGYHLKSIYHDGPITFYDHYRKAAFTRNSMTHAHGKTIPDSLGRINLKIFFADVEQSGALKNVTSFEHNNDHYSTAHTTFSSNGQTMFFASDKGGGLGGADIYYSRREGGKWSKPVNAGKSINTSGDEFYPFLSNDSTLYFASSGHGGFGGLDVFVSNRRKGVFQKARNLGSPINTSRDDFSLITDSTGRAGYLASNRKGDGTSDDIFFFKANHNYSYGVTRELGNPTHVIPNASIYMKDEHDNLIDSLQSDENGYFRIDLPLNQVYIISAKKPGYETLENISYINKERNLGVDSLLFELWKQDLTVKGIIYSKESQTKLAGATVTLMNLTDNTADSLVVGENGQYVFPVYPNKKYRIKVSKSGFVQGGFTLDTKDIYKGELVNDVVVEEVYIEKVTIHFDYNKSELSSASIRELDQIARTMRNFPDATLIIRAHADSRGSEEYNQRISNQRAEVTRQYIDKKGIATKRIDAKGFGEVLILNRCSDGVECTEEDHFLNRRAELKVQK